MSETQESSQQENQWIDLARAGNLPAFNHLVLAHQDAAFRFAKWLVHENTRAEDIVQTVFLAAYRQMSTYHSHYFRAWLLRMVRNACIDELRRRECHPYLILESQDADTEAEVKNPWVIHQQVTPEEMIIQHEDWESIEQSFHQLPEPLREVIILIDLERFDYQEAANVLRVPLSTIKSRLGQARARIRIPFILLHGTR